MLRYANALARMYGRQTASADAWGEDLVDQSLTTLWYPTTWEDVADDELVFLLPSLSRWRPQRAGIDGHNGPIDYLTRTLRSRAQSAARLIAGNFGRTPPSRAPEVLKHLNGYLTSLTPQQLSTLENDLVRRHSARGREHGRGTPGKLSAEFTALAYLDRMLSDALGNTNEHREVAPIVDWPLSLADAIAASVSARMNAAYAYPEFACAQELLSLSAILGHLLQGRVVYLPPSLAGALLDVLKDRTNDDASAAVLRAFANMAGGVDYLTAIARRISADGTARRIFPRQSTVARDTEPWNARLVQRIAQQKLWSTSRV